jgi:hypothetical protein
MKPSNLLAVINPEELNAALEFETFQSPLLGDHFDSHSHKNQLQHAAGCKLLLSELVGENESGKYRTPNGDITDALLPVCQQAVKNVEEQFLRLKSQAAASGRRIPESMPPDMHTRFVKSTARLQVCELEIQLVRDTLTKFKEQEIRISNSRVLPHGCPGIGKIAPRPGYPGGRLFDLDGQIIEPVEGIMYVCDPRSPFNGMRCADYIDFVVKPWGRERDRMMREDRAKAEAAGPGTTFHPNIQPPIPEWPECVPKPQTTTKKKRDGD